LAEEFAEKLKLKGYDKIVFVRNGKLYHGKIKLFCDNYEKIRY
jgi:ribosomal protein L18